jgi:hypothetical protein
MHEVKLRSATSLVILVEYLQTCSPVTCVHWHGIGTFGGGRDRLLVLTLPVFPSVFSRGTAAVGEDYLGHPIWDAYLAYETMQKAHPEIVAIYRKILHDCQLKELTKYMTRCWPFLLLRPLYSRSNKGLVFLTYMILETSAWQANPFINLVRQSALLWHSKGGPTAALVLEGAAVPLGRCFCSTGNLRGLTM